jgi:hypothetical protein
VTRPMDRALILLLASSAIYSGKKTILGKINFYTIFLMWGFDAIKSLMGSSVNVRDLL